MKKIFLLLALLLILGGCRTYESAFDKNLTTLAHDVLKHPEKLRDIQKYYPNFYNEEYISNSMFDTIKVNKTITFINNELNKLFICPIWSPNGVSPGEIERLHKEIKNQNLTFDHLYGFSVWKDKKGVSFDFVQFGNTYFIIAIYYCYMAEL
ncbi:MAG: hypothetical protein WCT77_08740 [Bacteroidota bacterium]